MNYGELRSHFKELLNRNDCDDTLADRFISSGLRRIERLLRTPFQRTVYTYTIPADWNGKIAIPADYLAIHEMRLEGVPLGRITQSQEDLFGGFRIEGTDFVISADAAEEDDEIELEYYAEFPKNVEDGTTTTYSLIIGDCTVYAAMVFACTYFTDARKADFQADLDTMISEVQLMADLDVFSGGNMVMTPYGGGVT